MKRILVVDDSRASRRLFRRCVEAAGLDQDLVLVEAEGAGQALAAIDAAADDPFALVLLDLNMPEVDGLELLRKLKRERARGFCRVALVTSEACGDRARQASSEGAPVLLRKPFDPRAVKRALAPLVLASLVPDAPRAMEGTAALPAETDLRAALEAASRDVLESAAFVATASLREEAAETPELIRAVVPFVAGGRRGEVVVAVAPAPARVLVEQLVGDAVEEDDVREGLVELANMIAGSLGTRVAPGIPVRLFPPRARPELERGLSLALETEVSVVHLGLNLEPRP